MCINFVKLKTLSSNNNNDSNVMICLSNFYETRTLVIVIVIGWAGIRVFGRQITVLNFVQLTLH